VEEACLFLILHRSRAEAGVLPLSAGCALGHLPSRRRRGSGASSRAGAGPEWLRRPGCSSTRLGPDSDTALSRRTPVAHAAGGPSCASCSLQQPPRLASTTTHMLQPQRWRWRGAATASTDTPRPPRRRRRQGQHPGLNAAAPLLLLLALAAAVVGPAHCAETYKRPRGLTAVPIAGKPSRMKAASAQLTDAWSRLVRGGLAGWFVVC
jgi:hypothetical protein